MDETTVALVADAARAHLFHVDVATGGWTPLETLSHGRNELQADLFASHLAGELARRYDDGTFRRLVLVAPEEFMGMLRNALPKRVAETVIEELTCDLSKVRSDELADRIPVPQP